MTDTGDNRVAVYIDFDNIVISRYDEVHGRSRFTRDKVRDYGRGILDDAAITARLQAAAVDLGAVIDYASSFGTLVLTRAYADWSLPVNSGYRGQLVSRAVDLVQLFPAAAYGKNGADIRLAVDAVEDMFRLPDLTHLVIVAGDSDYIALAQRAKRLGRYVVAVGVAGSTSRSLTAAVDELVSYDALPGVTQQTADEPDDHDDDADDHDAGDLASSPAAAPHQDAAPRDSRRHSRGDSGDAAQISAGEGAEPDPEAVTEQDDTSEPRSTRRSRSARTTARRQAAQLLERALRLGLEKDDTEWMHSSAVKSQMRRLDPSFSEKALGHSSFSDFVKANPKVAELDESSPVRLVRLATS